MFAAIANLIALPLAAPTSHQQQLSRRAMSRLMATFVLLFLSNEATYCQQAKSAYDMLEPCIAMEALYFSSTPPKVVPSAGDALEQGICIGTIEGIRHFINEATKTSPYPVCMPMNIRLGQVISVVVKFMRDNPHLLKESFITVTTVAISKSWPCK
jgi:hypothetical protein